MHLTNRRLFFKSLIDNVQENIQKTAISSFFNNKNKSSEKKIWVCLGHISDFPVGENIFVNNDSHVLISTDEGIFVINSETFKNNKREPRLLIKMGERGLIHMNCEKEIPVGTILSIMTGELITEEAF